MRSQVKVEYEILKFVVFTRVKKWARRCEGENHRTDNKPSFFNWFPSG